MGKKSSQETPGIETEVRTERERQERLVRWFRFLRKSPQIPRLHAILSVRMGTDYWCLDVKRKFQKTRAHRNI